MSTGKVVAVGVLVAAVAAGAVWWNRGTHGSPGKLGGLVPAQASACSAATLTRDEAIRRAHERLGKFSASLRLHERFTEPSARFDDDSKSWIVTFRSADCMVMMVVDRCKPNDLGGTTDCHAG